MGPATPSRLPGEPAPVCRAECGHTVRGLLARMAFDPATGWVFIDRDGRGPRVELQFESFAPDGHARLDCEFALYGSADAPRWIARDAVALYTMRYDEHAWEPVRLPHACEYYRLGGAIPPDGR